MAIDQTITRRRIVGAAGASIGTVLVGCSRGRDQPEAAKLFASSGGAEAGDEPSGVAVTVTEDLMREHGVVARVLCIYEAALVQLAKGERTPLPVLVDAAELVRSFVEDYHERLEEEHLFPRFERSGELVALVGTLRVQHDRGRVLTDRVHQLAGSSTAEIGAASPLSLALRDFVHMYRPHAAREDTVVFPAFRGLLEPAELRELGEIFEQTEHERFGAGGFDTIVGRVAALEHTLGIDELASYTA